MARALLIIDFQNDFVPGGALPVPEGDAIAGRVQELLDSGDFDFVVATRDWHPENHNSFAAQGGPWPPHCVQGTPGAELHGSLAPERVDVIINAGYEPHLEGYSGFEETDLAQVLREHDVDAVTVVGLATDYCVHATSLEALRQGFAVTVDREGIRGIDVEPGDSERALAELRDAGGERRLTLVERLHAGLRHWYPLLAQASNGAHTLTRDGVLAALVPVAPERSYLNAVVYDRPAALAAVYDELAAAYDRIGAKWTVWVPPGDREAAALLERAGHVLDAEPELMGRELPGIERPKDGELSGWTRDGALADVATVNDRAYRDDARSFARALRRLPHGAAHLYTVRERAGPVASAVVVDHEGNADIELVAVVPEARGRGLSGKLLAHALADAAERGCETTTLIATAMGRPVYERLGYRPLGQLQMWDQRRD